MKYQRIFNVVIGVWTSTALALSPALAQEKNEQTKAEKKAKKGKNSEESSDEGDGDDSSGETSAFTGKKIISGAAFRNGLARSGVHRAEGPQGSPKIKWKLQTGGPVLSSPVYWEKTIFVGTQNNAFLAVDADSGKEKWRLETAAPVGSSACIANGVAWFTSSDGNLWGVDVADGKVKQKIKINAKNTRCSPAVAYGAVYVYADGISAYDTETGKKVFSAKGSAGNEAAVTMNSTTEIHPTKGSGTDATNISTGEKAGNWTGIPSSVNNPAIMGDVAYLACTAYCNTGPNVPGIAAIDLKNLKKVWIKNAEPHVDDKQKAAIYGSPAVWKNWLYTGCDSGFLYAYTIRDGQPAWSFNTGGMVRSSPSIASESGSIYFTSRDGHLYSLNAETGKELWKLDIGNKPVPASKESCLDSGPWIQGKTLFVGSADGHVYAVE